MYNSEKNFTVLKFYNLDILTSLAFIFLFKLNQLFRAPFKLPYFLSILLYALRAFLPNHDWGGHALTLPFHSALFFLLNPTLSTAEVNWVLIDEMSLFHPVIWLLSIDISACLFASAAAAEAWFIAASAAASAAAWAAAAAALASSIADVSGSGISITGSSISSCISLIGISILLVIGVWPTHHLSIKNLASLTNTSVVEANE